MRISVKNFLIATSLSLTFIINLTSCNDDTDSTKNAMAAIVAKQAGITKVTFNTSHGRSVVNVDNSNKRIVSSDSTDAETNIVTSRTYTYDADNNIRTLDVKKLYSPDTRYEFAAKDTDCSRSWISDEIEKIPVARRTVVKQIGQTARSAAMEERTVTEYYADENGRIVAVLSRDAYNNVKIKIAEEDAK